MSSDEWMVLECFSKESLYQGVSSLSISQSLETRAHLRKLNTVFAVSSFSVKPRLRGLVARNWALTYTDLACLSSQKFEPPKYLFEC